MTADLTDIDPRLMVMDTGSHLIDHIGHHPVIGNHIGSRIRSHTVRLTDIRNLLTGNHIGNHTGNLIVPIDHPLDTGSPIDHPLSIGNLKGLHLGTGNLIGHIQVIGSPIGNLTGKTTNHSIIAQAPTDPRSILPPTALHTIMTTTMITVHQTSPLSREGVASTKVNQIKKAKLVSHGLQRNLKKRPRTIPTEAGSDLRIKTMNELPS